MDDNAIIMLSGIVIIAVSIIFLIRQMQKSKSSSSYTVEAKITEIKEETSEEECENGSRYNILVYYPVYEYCVDGIEYCVKSSFGVSHRDFEIGDTEMIRYDPDDPRKIYTKRSENSQYFVIGILIFVGIFAILIGSGNL